MAKQNVQLVILCEDTQHEVFARHYFTQRGINPRKIRIRKNPAGKGSGEQYVRQQYPQEVKTHRSKSNHLSTLLVVVIDADTTPVQYRLEQLDNTLINNSQQPRQPNEKIASFIPKRNIETWIHYLMGETVEEQTHYPKLSRTGECKPYIQELVTNICPAGLPDDAPPSLHAACDELERIL